MDMYEVCKFYAMLVLRSCFVFLSIGRPPRFTRSHTLFPHTALFRSCAARLQYTQPAVHGLAARQHKTACQPISACVKFGRNRKVEWKLDCRFASHRSCDPAVCVLVLKKIGRASCRERVCQYV